MKNEMKNDEAVSPVIATILMVAITVVLAGVLYVWASSLAGESTGGSLDTYVWSATDGASGDTTAAGGEALVRVQMDGGDATNWGVIAITISVNGGTPASCGTDASGSGCYYTTYQQSGEDDAEWSVGEGVVIHEGTEDICNGEGGCNVTVTIVKKGAGNEDDKVIGETFAAA